MKKILSAALIAATALALVSCGNGRSIPIETVKRANLTGNLLAGDCLSYTEKVEYFDGDKALSYTLSIENAENAADYSYNVVEKIGDYTLFAHEGDIFKQKGDEFCAVLFSNQSLTYYQYIKDYASDSLEAKFPLDAGERYQIMSNEDGDSIFVSYYADVTPQMASAITSVSLRTGDRIVSEYTTDKGYRIQKIEYFVERGESEKTLVAKRTFTYSDKKSGAFSSLPGGDDVTVTLVIGGREYEYSVPSGVYVEFEDGGLGYEYFTDEKCTQKYELSKAREMTVYVKTNFD